MKLALSWIALLIIFSSSVCHAESPSKLAAFCRSLVLKLKVMGTHWRSEAKSISAASELMGSIDSADTEAALSILRMLFREDELKEIFPPRPRGYPTVNTLRAALTAKAQWRKGPPRNRFVYDDPSGPGFWASTEATELLTFSDYFLQVETLIPELNLEHISELRWYEALAESMNPAEALELARFVSGRGPNPWDFRQTFNPLVKDENFTSMDLTRALFLKIPRAVYLLREWEKRQPTFFPVSLSKLAVSDLIGNILIADFPLQGLGLQDGILANEILIILKTFTASELEHMIRKRLMSSKAAPTTFHPFSRLVIDYKPGTIAFMHELEVFFSFEDLFFEKGVSPLLIGEWQMWMADGAKLRFE